MDQPRALRTRGRRLGLAWIGLALVVSATFASRSHADEERTAYLRVLAEASAVRSGPGFAYRVAYRAQRGEVFEVVERGTRGYWFRILLPDGTFGWIVGDETFPYEVDPSAQTSGGFLPGLMAPPPLVKGAGQVAIGVGTIGNEGVLFLRPGVLIDASLGLEGYVGESIAADGNVLFFGAALVLYFAPRFPVCPFVSVGGGGVASFPHNDVFALRGALYNTIHAGGGLVLSFSKRLTLRVEVRNHSVFDPNFFRNLQEYSGGMAIYF